MVRVKDAKPSSCTNFVFAHGLSFLEERVGGSGAQRGCQASKPTGQRDGKPSDSHKLLASDVRYCMPKSDPSRSAMAEYDYTATK